MRLTPALASIALLLAACGDDIAPRGDAGGRDGGGIDAGVDGDGGGLDAAPRDSGGEDTGPIDAGPMDSGAVDSGRDAGGGAVDPPLRGSSGGSGGGPAAGDARMAPGGVSYLLSVPASYREGTPSALMIVFSGTEGARTMMMNLRGAGPSLGLGDVIFAVLDGPSTFGDGGAGAAVLDHVRAAYNIDNDRTFLLSESAGTRAGLMLGLSLRQSYFAAYWANDVNASATPARTAAELGFAPWGNAGPGGDLPDAMAIVSGMRAAGYRIAEPAPYDGPGSGTHGSPEQFVAALRWFVGRSRR